MNLPRSAAVPALLCAAILAAYFGSLSNGFAGDARVTLYRGDSSRLLGEMIAGIRSPITFWLDGHWSGGDHSQREPHVRLGRDTDQ